MDANEALIQCSEYSLDELRAMKLSDLYFESYQGGQIFGDATIEQLNDDQSIVQIISKEKKKIYAICTVFEQELEGETITELHLQDVTPLIVDLEYYEFTSNAAKVGGWEFDVLNNTFRASKEVYDIHEVGLHSFFEISHPFKFYGRSVQELMREEFRDCIINQQPKTFEKLPFYSSIGTKKWVRLTFTPVVAHEMTIKIFGSLQDISAQVQLEDELEVSRKKYEDLFDYSPNPLFVIRCNDHRIVQVNKAAVDFYGYSKEEFAELTAYDIRPESQYESYEHHTADIAGEFGEIRRFRKIAHLDKQGNPLLVDVFRRGAYLEGEAVHILLIHDIKAKHEAEIKLSQMNDLLGKLIDSSPLAIITVDDQAKVELWNNCAEEIFGWTKSEVFGKQIPFIPDQKANEFKNNLKNGFELTESIVLELDRQTKTGQPISIREHVTPLRNAEGKVDRLMLIIEDVTEQLETRRALSESERNYRNLVEASNDLIWRLNKEFEITFINHASLEILGYEPSKLLKQLLVDLICDEQKSEWITLNKQVLKGRKVENVDFQMRNREGALRHLNATMYPTYDSSGKVVGCTGNASDITHIIQYQHHLETMLKEKEILIKEIHHRVKNNLAVVSGLLSLQASNQVNKNTIQVLRESQSRIQSIATIHEKLYQSELFTQIEMRSYLKQLVEDIRLTYSSKTKSITVRVDGDEVFLNVNQAVPFGILTNELVINAFKYAFTDQHSGEIVLDLQKKKSGEILFHISDNGVGLPETFSMNSNKSLGMTLVKSLSIQLDAELSYWTENGTHFSLTFTPM